jgi:hypothetical protein
MVDNPSPADLSDVDKIFGTTPVGGEKTTTSATPAQSFASFMKPEGTPMQTAGKTSMISPFELAQGQPPLAQSPTLATLMAQVNSAQNTLGDVSTQLNTPKLKLKPSQRYLLKNKLSDANSHLRSANAKMGGEMPKEIDVSKFKGPLGKFFAFLNDGATQLEAAKNQLQSLKNKGQNLTPADFLLIQVKLNKATQELEYSSVLLSNAVSSLKMLMQVQI